MAMSVWPSVNVVETPVFSIAEYHGHVASKSSNMSACLETIASAAEKPYQTAAFDVYVLVLEGCVELHISSGVKTVAAGCGAFLSKGLRVKWVWPGPCKFVAICLPAFTPETCVVEDGADVSAETPKSTTALMQRRYKSMFPYVYHVALKNLWDKSKSEGRVYYPPTFEQDGKFTHATADPSKLLDVLNHFYKQEPGDWVCLRMTVDGLEAAGVETVFEATAPVGDTPSIDMGDQLFPHIQGGIPPEAVIAEHSVARSEDGAFVCIVGVCNGATTTFRKKMFSLLSQVADFTKRTQAPALVFMAGVCVGTAFARRRA